MLMSFSLIRSLESAPLNSYSIFILDEMEIFYLFQIYFTKFKLLIIITNSNLNIQHNVYFRLLCDV